MWCTRLQALTVDPGWYWPVPMETGLGSEPAFACLLYSPSTLGTGRTWQWQPGPKQTLTMLWAYPARNQFSCEMLAQCKAPEVFSSAFQSCLTLCNPVDSSQSITSSRSLLKVMSIELVMPSNHLTLCLLRCLIQKYFISSSATLLLLRATSRPQWKELMKEIQANCSQDLEFEKAKQKNQEERNNIGNLPFLKQW